MPVIRFKPAKVAIQREKYVLTVGQTKKELLIGEFNDAASARKLVGKPDVEVAMSGRNIVAIGRRVAPCYWIVCYIPVPDIFRRILPEIRQQLLQKYLDADIIDRKFADELKASF
jgi:hypothetical protein